MNMNMKNLSGSTFWLCVENFYKVSQLEWTYLILGV